MAEGDRERDPYATRLWKSWKRFSAKAHAASVTMVPPAVVMFAVTLIAAPASATPASPASAGRRVEERPNTTRLIIGGAMFGVPYAVGFGYAAARDESPRGMEKDLLVVPVVGPLLAIRGIGCNDTGDVGNDCSTSGGQGIWLTLLLDAVVQGTGVILIGSAFWSPDRVVTRAHEQSLHVWVAPQQLRHGRALAVVGTF